MSSPFLEVTHDSASCTFHMHYLLAVDYFRTSRARMYEVPRGAYITPGFECLGALCNDGGEKVELDYEI